MAKAIGETRRRREKQVAHNELNHIEPKSVRKEVRDILDLVSSTDDKMAAAKLKGDKLPREIAVAMANEIEKKMKESAGNLEFEKAAALRDELLELRKQIGGQRIDPLPRPRPQNLPTRPKRTRRHLEDSGSIVRVPISSVLLEPEPIGFGLRPSRPSRAVAKVNGFPESLTWSPRPSCTAMS